MLRKLLLTAFLFGVQMVACASAPRVQPRLDGGWPEDAIPVTVRDSYKTWWSEIEECSGGRRVRYEDVRWFAIMHHPPYGFWWTDKFGERLQVAGLAFSDRNAIVMGEGWLFKADFIRHEMLHLLASPLGHSPEMFQRRCRDLVLCIGRCLTDTL
jgi:hypothetical protein